MISNQSFESTLNNKSVAPSMAQRRNGVFRTWCASLMVSALSITGLRGADPLPVNSVTASAHDGNVPANAIDGSMATRWSASGDGQWIQFDLGASRPVGSVAIAWYQGDQRTSRFDIRTSLDQSAWTPVFSGVSSGTSTGMETYDVADSTARYVSIVCHGNSVNLWNSIAEVDLFAPLNGTTINYRLLNKSTLSLQWNSEPGAVYQVQASSDHLSWADISAPITSTTTTQTWSDNVPTPRSPTTAARFYRVKKHPPTSQQPTVNLTASDASAAEGSSNPGTFTFTRNGNTTSNLIVRYTVGGTAAQGTDFATLSGSVTIPSGSASTTLAVTPTDDTSVEGSETVALALSANAAYVVGSPSSATVTISDNDSGGGGGGTLPSSVLNLSNWKLTLPVDTSHAGSPDEYKQPELAGYQNSNYFYVNSARDGVVFTAHCGGYTTSGSGYPRSELREMTSGGSANASWSTTSGTHTMEIRQAITHLPVAKPHVVVGQIHDASDDVIVFRLEGSTLFVDENGERGPVLTSNYQLGTVFTVKFVARNGGIEAYYNGQYVYTYSKSTSGCYFKAGCYTQSNTERGDSASAYGQVVIYNVTVTHQ